MMMRKRQLIRGVLIPIVVVGCFVKCLSQTTLPTRAVATPLLFSFGPPVEIKFREMRFGTPPLVRLYFDITLRNHRDEPRWFLLPSNLSADAAPIASKGGVDHVEVFAPRGEGRVVIGHFLGTGGFHALRLPAGAQVRLRLFSISYWGDVPAQLRIEVVTAKRLRIGDENAETWFSTDPTSSLKADIAENAEDAMHTISSKATPDNREVATFVEEDGRYEIQVSLGKKNKDSQRKTKSHERLNRMRNHV
jgi:hypothetical protein